MIFKRKLQPPRWRLGLSRRFRWLAYRQTDYQLAYQVTGTVNRRRWRGYNAGTCLVSGIRIQDAEVEFTIEHEPHGTDLVFVVDGTVRSFQVYRQLDFNRFDLGTPVPIEPSITLPVLVIDFDALEFGCDWAQAL